MGGCSGHLLEGLARLYDMEKQKQKRKDSEKTPAENT